MGIVIQFPHSVPQYCVVDGGVMPYEEGTVISAAQLKNDATAWDLTIEDVLDEIHIVEL